MIQQNELLTDTHGRKHQYLRISLTERCNLRCSYCMPKEGVLLTPKEHLMQAEEIFTIAKIFVKHGVTKIRLTGGEPFVRKDIAPIIERLAELPVTLTLTTNAVTIHRHIDLLRSANIKTLNVSLDTLQRSRFKAITYRDQFARVEENIALLLNNGFRVKLNVVLMKGVNADEILDFVQRSVEEPLDVRFIEFMPFDGNRWNFDKLVPMETIIKVVKAAYGEMGVLRLEDAPNDTAKNYKILGAKGRFAIISTVTNPFCDSCNRLRLTANGRIKNCLFSQSETDILTALRSGLPLEPLIQQAIAAKQAVRGGMDDLEKLRNPDLHSQNRSMITIGG